MSLTLDPLPSLAGILAPYGGLMPARMIDVFAARDVYASTIAVPDCNIDTGGKVDPKTGTPAAGTPTDNASALNAFLASPTGRLVFDGGYAVGSPIIYHSSNAIGGMGDHTGVFMLSGSNSSVFQNFADTDLAEYQAWSPASVGSQATVLTSNVDFRGFKINGNRGTYPNGNSNGTTDGTITGSTPAGIQGPPIASGPDARGPYAAGGYWLSGIIGVGVDNFRIKDVFIYDSPSYGVNLYHCTRGWIDDLRVEAGNPSFSGNTDAIHLNGGCSSITIDGIWASVGDDVLGCNADEGDKSPISDIVMANVTVENCQTVVRTYGNASAVKRVQVHHVKGTGIRYWVAQIGQGPGAVSTLAEACSSVELSDIEADVTGTGAGYGYGIVYITGSAGVIDLNRIKHIEPTRAIPMVLMDTGSVVSSLRMNDCLIHRNLNGNAAAYAFDGTAGTIGELSVTNFRVTEQSGQAYTDIPILFNLEGTAVGKLDLDATVKGVATVVNVTTASTVGGISINHLDHRSNAPGPTAHSIVAATSSGTIPVSLGRYTGTNLAGIASGPVALTGPGLVSSGFAIPDAMAGNNTIYQSSTQGGLAFKAGGTVGSFTFAGSAATSYTLTGPGSGGVGVASSPFTVTPNGLYSGPITITPSGGGLSTPIVLSFGGSSAPQTFTIDPTAAGTVTLTPTNGGSLANPAPVTYAASAGAATVLNDTFAGSAGAILTGHAPNTGTGTWADFVASLSLPGWVFTGTGGITTAAGSSGLAFGGFDLSSASPTQTATFVFNATSLVPPVILQLHRTGPTSSANYIEVDFTTVNGKVQVSQSVAGTTTLVGAAASYSFAAGTDYTAVVQVVTGGGTTTLNITVNGTPVVTGATVTDSSLQVSGQLVLGTESGAVGAMTIKSATVTNP